MGVTDRMSVDYREALEATFDPKARDELLKSIDRRLETGQPYAVPVEIIDKAGPVRRNVVPGKNITIAQLTKLFRK